MWVTSALRRIVYLGFYVAFNTVQVISRQVVGRAEETSTYSSLGFCTVNCRPTASNGKQLPAFPTPLKIGNTRIRLCRAPTTWVVTKINGHRDKRSSKFSNQSSVNGKIVQITASRRNLAHLEYKILICCYYLFNIVDFY